MSYKRFLPKMILLLGRVMPGLMLVLLTRQAQANPTGMTVQSGSASASTSGSRLIVTAGNNAFLNWQHFNIGAGETTIFNQPSASSIVWNRINDSNPSQIYGSLQANGVVVLLNSSGFYFGPNSFVSAAGLVVSTANCLPPQNAGGIWEFNGPPPLASIVNYGQIRVGQGGSCFLIADQVENHGDIEAPGGSIGLASGETVMLSERPDGRGMSMEVTLPKGSVNNYGTLVADAGTIAMDAKVVNQGGFIQADSIKNVNGTIELVADDQLNLGAGSQIVANGDASAGGSAGGNVTLKSNNSFSDAGGSQISATGGANGGNGGTVEISAPAMQSIHSKIDGSAQVGSTGGQLLIDPDFITLDTSGSDTVGSGGTVNVGDNSGQTLDFNVNSAFIGFNSITLQAAYDINIADGTQWNLSASTGQANGQLTLEAGRNINFGNSSAILDGNNWSVSLYAGVTDFQHQIVQSGAGTITIDSNNQNSPSFIQAASGSISLVAGQDITLGNGYVNTIAGGNISAHALAGNIDTGGIAQGYFFQGADSGANTVDQACVVGPFVGGISTLAGGNVNLTAGGNVTSALPSTYGTGYYYDGAALPYGNTTYDSLTGAFDGTAGSGAYGNQPGQNGDVTIVAGGNVTGHYLVAHGTGTIYAGVMMDSSGNPEKDASGHYIMGNAGSAGADDSANQLALSLGSGAVDQNDNEVSSGGWNVTAAQNIYLQEVRNPNGVLDVQTGGAEHYFDYGTDDYVNLAAGNLVELGSTLMPRDPNDTLSVPPVYPSIVNISSGASGVNLEGDGTAPFSQLILFPSPQGNLTINTTQGGSLYSTLPASAGAPQIFKLMVSDAADPDTGNRQYLASGTFGTGDNASSPIHANDPNPIELNISGDMDLISLFAPKAAQINVVGNMNNCLFQAMNLPGDLNSSITVGADAKSNMEKMGVLNAATDSGLIVGGQIDNRSAFTSVTLGASDSAPNFALLADAYGNVVNGKSLDAETLLSSFYYNPTTGVLTYQNIAGFSLAAVLSQLENLQVQAVDANGNPEFTYDINGNPIPVLTHVSVIDPNVATKLLAEYTSGGLVPSASGGYIVGGGGTFNIDAANIDLGTTFGIESVGVGLYQVGTDYPLANLFTKGADININLTGDLTMYSSAVATLNGGDITIGTFGNPIGGSVSVGSSEFNVVSKNPRGIFTTGQGNVSIIANGDIDVNSSRIAAYDGGSVTVASLDGSVNAGSGGSGYVNVSSFSVAGGQGIPNYSTIPGSGILATTFVDDPGQVVGNILVESPNGNVNANAGGVVQLPFNGVNTASSLVDVLAGYEMQDSHGIPILAADMASGTIAKVNNSANGGNIDASGSGVIGSTVELKATGNIIGAIFARDNLVINAQQNVNVTALSEGNLSVGSANGSISGTLIGVGGISASGASDSANLESNNGISGSTSGSKGLAQGTAANATSSAASANQEDSANSAVKTDTATDDDSQKKKKPITLARKVSRVTVLLPGKN